MIYGLKQNVVVVIEGLGILEELTSDSTNALFLGGLYFGSPNLLYGKVLNKLYSLFYKKKTLLPKK